MRSQGEVRPDVDPVRLRWAGLPRSRAFDPVDLRREQREYLNVLYLRNGDAWRLATFEDPDFDPGFATDLPLEGRHALQISIFADNAATVASMLVADATADRHNPYCASTNWPTKVGPPPQPTAVRHAQEGDCQHDLP